MSGIPKVATDVQHAVEQGRLCASCGSEFVHAHGHPVSCGYCFSRLDSVDRQRFPKATHEEVAQHFGKIASRKKRRD